EQLKNRIRDQADQFDDSWYRDLREHILEDITLEPSSDDPFTVRNVLPVLRETMAPDDVLISDVGSHKMRIAQNYLTYEPNTCIISNGLASMGISVPGGIAADIATDGGFLMNGAELETATRIGCDYTILLFNNNDYGLISEKQHAHRGETYGTSLSNPDYLTFAESFGIDGYRPTDWDELRHTLEQTIPTQGMALVEVPLD
ncbi:MAG: thiamine pyrophosphate-dependent enzyme, partial [Halobacteriaceae archaeon]